MSLYRAALKPLAKSNHGFESSLVCQVLFHSFIMLIYLFVYLSIYSVKMNWPCLQRVLFTTAREEVYSERSPREIFVNTVAVGQVFLGVLRFFLVCDYLTSYPYSFLYRGWVLGPIINRSVIYTQFDPTLRDKGKKVRSHPNCSFRGFPPHCRTGTEYGLDDKRFESWQSQDIFLFFTTSNPVLGSTHLLAQWVQCFFPAANAAEAWSWPLSLI
jgi:hypothetical protein